MTLALDQLGKDAVMYLAGRGAAPGRVRFMRSTSSAARAAGRRRRSASLVALDCANETPDRARPGDARRARRSSSTSTTTTTTRASATSTSSSPDASSTGEIARATSSRELGVELTPEIAEALYIALVTDTGRFQYANTTPKALRLAAELVEAGADVHRVFQGVYEIVAVREAEAARARARAGAGLRGRPARRLVPAARRLRRGRRRASRTRRGSSTTCAPSRAPRWRR